MVPISVYAGLPTDLSSQLTNLSTVLTDAAVIYDDIVNNEEG